MKTNLPLLCACLLIGAAIYLGMKPVAIGKHAAPSASDRIAHGAYLVRLGGCADCHTPKIITAHGPVDDATRALSGHPADVVLPPPGPDAGPWGASTAGMTAWSGPWGISYAANLTPDSATGIGDWTEETFIHAMKSGRHRGTGRQILPPMPWQTLAAATDEDLKSIYAYLRSVPSIVNPVPDPAPPASKPD